MFCRSSYDHRQFGYVNYVARRVYYMGGVWVKVLSENAEFYLKSYVNPQLAYVKKCRFPCIISKEELGSRTQVRKYIHGGGASDGPGLVLGHRSGPPKNQKHQFRRKVETWGGCCVRKRQPKQSTQAPRTRRTKKTKNAETRESNHKPVCVMNPPRWRSAKFAPLTNSVSSHIYKMCVSHSQCAAPFSAIAQFICADLAIETWLNRDRYLIVAAFQGISANTRGQRERPQKRERIFESVSKPPKISIQNKSHNTRSSIQCELWK